MSFQRAAEETDFSQRVENYASCTDPEEAEIPEGVQFVQTSMFTENHQQNVQVPDTGESGIRTEEGRHCGTSTKVLSCYATRQEGRTIRGTS